MDQLKTAVIIGSTREGRFSEKPARYVFDELNKREGVEAELLDLRDWPLPLFDQPISPSMKDKPYPYEIVEKWAAKIGAADGFIVVSPEYNHGYPAVLKNAFDWVFKEWAHKPIGFVSYGSVMGGRVIEQLRLVAVELSMVPLRPAIHIPGEIFAKARAATVPDAIAESFAPLRSPTDRVATLFDELLLLARALKPLHA